MAGATILEGAKVFTATGEGAAFDAAVEIVGARIGRVGPRDAAVEGETIDLTGCTVLPGLIDTHIHIFHEAQMRRLPEGAAALWGANYMQSALRAGVTTVRDLGAQTPAVHGLKWAEAEGVVVGPRILACGTAICMTGGHGWANLSKEADGPDAVRTLARQQIKDGADVIKVMASGGAGTPGELPTQAQLTVAELRAAVEEAHAAGRPVAAHALARQGILNAIEAGVDTVEHGVYLDEEGIEGLLRNDIALCPTISVYPRIVARGPEGGEAAFVVEKSRPLGDIHFANFRRAVEAGVRIVFGTDSATLYNPVGDFADEMRLMEAAGMSPAAIIRSATRVAAEICHIADDVGTIETGRTADLVVVDGDPTQNLETLFDPRLVFRKGVLVYNRDAGFRHANLTARPVLPRDLARTGTAADDGQPN